MTTGTGNFAELLWPGIAEIFGKKYADYPQIWSRVLDRKESNKAFEKYQGVTGLGLAAIKDQGNTFDYDDPIQGFQKEAVNVTYALGASVTKEMFDDDQYDYINSLPEMLARSMRHTEETVAARLLNNGFSTELTADGVSLFNASHLLAGVAGGTYRNTPSVAADLTQTSLEQAFIDIMDWVDDRGLRVMAAPQKLVVPTALRFVAEKILKTQFEVGNNDNTINPMAGAVEPIVWPFLTDPDAWFLKTDVPNGLLFVDREAASINRDNEFNTRNLLFATFRRFTVIPVDGRGAYGSPGA